MKVNIPSARFIGSKNLNDVSFEDFYLVVGPEGGFSDEELKYSSRKQK